MGLKPSPKPRDTLGQLLIISVLQFFFHIYNKATNIYFIIALLKANKIMNKQYLNCIALFHLLI